MSPNLLAKPASQPFWRNPRLACVGALALVFLCGAVAGALAMNLGHRTLHKSPFWTESGKAVYLDKVRRELDLTPVQTEQMESILDDFAKYYRTVLSDGKSRMMQILNEQQRRKFELMLQTQR
jgi:hypothetical protein